MSNDSLIELLQEAAAIGALTIHPDHTDEQGALLAKLYCASKVTEPPIHKSLVMRLDSLAAHLESLDSASGEAMLLRETIKAMGEVSKDSLCTDDGLLSSRNLERNQADANRTSPANPIFTGKLTYPSEISVVESLEDKLEEASYRPKGWDNSVVDFGVALSILKEAFTTKPVLGDTVSLVHCARAISDYQLSTLSNSGWSPNDHYNHWRDEFISTAKTVLDAAGVSYVD